MRKHADEEHKFSIDDVLNRLAEKLINRHPHVFGDVKAETSGDVLRNWDAIKAEENRKRHDGDQPKSILTGVSSAMPALLEARKLGSRAAKAGFDWPDVNGIFDKLQEETRELQEELRESRSSGPDEAGRGRLEEELGDLFFVLVNLARHLSLDPESALKRGNRKFKRRFQWIEGQLRTSGRAPQDVTMEELESLWQQAKQNV